MPPTKFSYAKPLRACRYDSYAGHTADAGSALTLNPPYVGMEGSFRFCFEPIIVKL